MSVNEFTILRQFFSEDVVDSEFDKIMYRVELTKTVMHQFNSIFVDTLYKDADGVMAKAADKSVQKLIGTFKQKFIEKSLEIGCLATFPDPLEISEWICEIHKDIASQIYALDFNEKVLFRALEDITKAIRELIEEAAQDGEIKEEDKC